MSAHPKPDVEEEPTAKRTKANPTQLSIVHFNDVYHIGAREREPVGGGARFATAIARETDALVLFSGDCFAPSLEATVFKGDHMLPVINNLGIAAAVFGNHDFDFGVDQLEKLSQKTPFPWVISNCDDVASGEPVCDGVRSVVLDHGGLKVGVMGLIEPGWLETLCVDACTLHYTDFVETGAKVATELREAGADVIIALTHMREYNDKKLAEEVQELDMILGGHDHFAANELIGTTLYVKSGNDFRNYSLIEVDLSGETPSYNVTLKDVTGEIEENATVAAEVEEFLSELEQKMSKPIGKSVVELNCRTQALRTSETNFGNFVTDIMRRAYGSDVAVLNSGTIRSDDVYGPGEFTLGDLSNVLPYYDTVVVLELTGAQLKACLENGVCKYPAQEGRFLQVSGLKFVFDPSQPEGQRIVSVHVGDEPLDEEKAYTMATKEYMLEGKDGFDMLADTKILVDDESGAVLPILVRNHFTLLDVLNGFKPSKTPVERAANRFKKLIHKGDNEYAIHPVVEGRISTV